jgi:hypothetical protein
MEVVLVLRWATQPVIRSLERSPCLDRMACCQVETITDTGKWVGSMLVLAPDQLITGHDFVDPGVPDPAATAVRGISLTTPRTPEDRPTADGRLL